MQLVRHCEPKNVLLVHGENAKMDFLRQKIMQVGDGGGYVGWVICGGLQCRLVVGECFVGDHTL